MKKKTSIINGVLTLVVTMGLLCMSAYFATKLGGTNLLVAICLFVAGAIIFGLLNAFLHEVGHLLAGKLNNFEFISLTVWFFSWKSVKGKIKFNFSWLGEEAGSTEMVSRSTENLEIRFKKLTAGGIIFSFVLMVLGILPIIFMQYIPYELFCLLSMCLPLSAYYFFGNALPTVTDGFRNDGAVLLGLNRKDDVSRVTLSLLSIQSELLNGKTPCQIDEKYYFDLPQLPEDDINFIMLLNARYSYYLDGEDYENAKKTSNRLMGLLDYMPKSMGVIIKADALYKACTFDFNEEKADELMYECEKYLNSVNTATNVTIKLAYMLNVVKEEIDVLEFYKKGKREAKRNALKGYGTYEKKLLDSVVANHVNVEE